MKLILPEQVKLYNWLENRTPSERFFTLNEECLIITDCNNLLIFKADGVILLFDFERDVFKKMENSNEAKTHIRNTEYSLGVI